MKPEFEPDKSIYLQIAESIEDDILQGVIDEETQVPSTNQLAALYRINPATAAKGLNQLVLEGTLYKKRGIGMFVKTGAVDEIRKKRKQAFQERFVLPLIEEAASLEISRDELIAMIGGGEEKS